MKKFKAMVVTALMVTMLFSGCGKSEAPDSTDKGDSTPANTETKDEGDAAETTTGAINSPPFLSASRVAAA